MEKLRSFLWIWVVLGLLTGCTAQPSVRSGREENRTGKPVVEPVYLTFPHTLPNGLVAEALLCHTGPYWEDGSGQPVENVAGLMLYNPTEQLLRFAAISVEQDGRQLHFFAYRVPPKSHCLVLEYEKKTCDPQRAVACSVRSVRWGYPDYSRQQLDYVCLGPQMTVINRDSRMLESVTVWYKHYMQDGDYYYGGKAYPVRLYFLQPEERRSVLPEHYNAATARIVGLELGI